MAAVLLSTVTAYADAQIAISVAVPPYPSVEFANVFVPPSGPANHVDASFTITNSGTAYIWGPTLAFDRPQFMMLGHTCAAGLSPGQACTVTLRYTPQAAGEFWSAGATVGFSGLPVLYPVQLFVRSFSMVLPAAPAMFGAVAGDGQATVSFAPGANGGSPISSFIVTSTPPGGTGSCGSATCTSAVVTGLTNFVSYTFTVSAVNAIGTGPASAPSAAVLPVPVVSPALNSLGDAGLFVGNVRSDLPDGKGVHNDWLRLHYLNYASERSFVNPLNQQTFSFDTWFGCQFSPRGRPAQSGPNVTFSDTSNFCPGYRAAPAIFGIPDPARELYGRSYWTSGAQLREACGGNPFDVNNVIGDSWKSCISFGSNTFYSNAGPTPAQYWMIHANSDPSFDQCNAGPPTMSDFITDPYSNASPSLYKIGLEPLGNGKKRMHVVVAPGEHDFPCATTPAVKAYKIPFLSVGVHKDHGNATGLGAWYWTSTGALPALRPHLQFNARLHRLQPIACKPGDENVGTILGPNAKLCTPGTTGYHAGFYVFAIWNGIQRLLFVNLANDNLGVGKLNWSWPIEDSAFYPGGEVVVINADTLAQTCGVTLPMLQKPAVGTTGSTPNQGYDLDLIKLLTCVMPPANSVYSTDLTKFSNRPTSEGALVSILGVHWFVEVNGTSGAVELTYDDPLLIYQ